MTYQRKTRDEFTIRQWLSLSEHRYGWVVIYQTNNHKRADTKLRKLQEAARDNKYPEYFKLKRTRVLV